MYEKNQILQTYFYNPTLWFWFDSFTYTIQNVYVIITNILRRVLDYTAAENLKPRKVFT